MKKKKQKALSACTHTHVCGFSNEVKFIHSYIFIKRNIQKANQIRHFLYTYYVPRTALCSVDKKLTINKIEQSL